MSGTGATTTGANPAAASPTPASGTTSSPSTTLNVGMGPKKSESAQPSGSRQSSSQPANYDDNWWKEHGEHVFKHERFQELSGYKQRWEGVAPLVEEYGDVEGLKALHQHLGPVWKQISSMPSDQANAVWKKVYPVLMAIANGDPVDPLLAQQANNAMAAAQGAEADEDDPLVSELNSVKKDFTEFKTSLEQERMAKRQQDAQATAEKNYNTYSDRFLEKAKEANIPEDVLDVLGDLQVSRIIRYMPKDQQGRPTNPLYNFSEKAFDECFEKEIIPAWKKMSQASVAGAIKETNGGAALPNSHNNGATPTGSAVQPNRKAKSARLERFIQTGHF